MKNKDVYFLIEHQSTIDYSMPFRIAEYCILIMKSAIDEKHIKNKNYKFPLVYPIVLYTGKEKWNHKKYLEENQEKKGKNIIIADLTSIEDTICKYFVICQGNSPSQVNAIVDSVKEFARKGADSKPTAIDGLRNAEWVAMDYSDVLVHVFLPEVRSFYNLEHLWADAKLTQIPDLD